MLYRIGGLTRAPGYQDFKEEMDLEPLRVA